MLCLLLAESAYHFWFPSELDNVANPDFESLKHLQNPGHFLMTVPSRLCKILIFVILYFVGYCASVGLTKYSRLKIGLRIKI